MRDIGRTGASSPPAMAEWWRCSPSTRGASPVERDWRGSGASRCRGEHGALARRCRKARWHVGHTRGGGALAEEESEGKRGLTVHYQVLGGVSRNSEARAELGERGIDEWLARLGGTAGAELGAQMATVVLCAHGWQQRGR